jgi:sporulation protein YlmC with PRC-barrel domain
MDQPALEAPAQPSESQSPAQPSEAMPPADSSEATPPAESSEAAPQSISLEQPRATTPGQSAQFLPGQKNGDWLASNLIGKSVVNAENETIGDVNDLVTDENGKIVAALIGAGGFLGIGEKDVAVRFEDLKLARDENDDVKVILDISKDTLVAAPAYKTLDEQEVAVGANKSDREDSNENNAHRTY